MLMENDTDGMHEVGIKLYVQTLQHEVMLIACISKTYPMIII